MAEAVTYLLSRTCFIWTAVTYLFQRVISTKWRDRLLIHIINLTVHKGFMLSTTFDFPGHQRHCSVLAFEVPGFSQGLLPP